MRGRPSPIDGHVGRRLRARRALLGMSQERLGELLGLTFQQIQKYERGANRIGSSRLYEIGQALDVPVSYFFEDAPATASADAAIVGLAEDGPEFEHGEAPAWPGEGEPPPLDSREVLELVRAYNRIRDPEVRRRLCDLARALAGLRYREMDPDEGRP
jgi:transcriptional regulator with XRE-family HTH domain